MKQTKTQYEEKQWDTIQRLKFEIKELKELNIDLQLQLHQIKELSQSNEVKKE